VVWASHPKVPQDHLFSINSYAEFETYCVWAIDDSMTQPDALQRIRVVDDSRWADIRWVEFAGEETACDDVHSQTYRIYFYTDDDIDWSVCGAGVAGCAVGVPPKRFDPASGHEEEVTFEIDLDTDYFKGFYEPFGPVLVNHEVGHALGLDDDEEDTECAVPSIMHGPNLFSLCSVVPTDADAASVLALEPGGSVGWSIFTYNKSWF
jgi:hypothetical protein